MWVKKNPTIFIPLFFLIFFATKVTDAGLKDLKSLESLTFLDLSWTEISDAGLKELKTLKKLATLRIVHTNATDAGILGLRSALPACHIVR